MTRDDIIRMARQAGIGQTGLWFSCVEEELERFANLVAAAERDACLQQTQIVVEAEREACATIIQRAGLPSIADAIRARGKG
jgi:hypothetical protein